MTFSTNTVIEFETDTIFLQQADTFFSNESYNVYLKPFQWIIPWIPFNLSIKLPSALTVTCTKTFPGLSLRFCILRLLSQVLSWASIPQNAIVYLMMWSHHSSKNAFSASLLPLSWGKGNSAKILFLWRNYSNKIWRFFFTYLQVIHLLILHLTE